MSSRFLPDRVLVRIQSGAPVWTCSVNGSTDALIKRAQPITAEPEFDSQQVYQTSGSTLTL